MKVFKENITYTSNIMVVKEERFDFNEFPFHYHPEYEIIYIMKGAGQRFVGDSIADFQKGELYIFGPNLPHTFYNKHLSKDRAIHQIVIQFDEHFLGKGFFDKAPFRSITKKNLRKKKKDPNPDPGQNILQFPQRKLIKRSITLCCTQFDLLKHQFFMSLLSKRIINMIAGNSIQPGPKTIQLR